MYTTRFEHCICERLRKILDLMGNSICGGKPASRTSWTKKSPAPVSLPCKATTIPVQDDVSTKSSFARQKIIIWHVICIPKRTNVIKKPYVWFQDFLEQYEAQQISNPILSVPQQFLVGKKAGKVKKWHIPNLVSSNECAVVPFKNVILPPQNNFSQLSS